VNQCVNVRSSVQCNRLQWSSCGGATVSPSQH